MIEIKITSHVPSLAFEAYWGSGKPGPYVSGISHPYIHLVNWRKMIIEIKLTSHMRSKAREAYRGSDIPTGPSGI